MIVFGEFTTNNLLPLCCPKEQGKFSHLYLYIQLALMGTRIIHAESSGFSGWDLFSRKPWHFRLQPCCGHWGGSAGMGWGCARGGWRVAIFIFLRSGVEGKGGIWMDAL